MVTPKFVTKIRIAVPPNTAVHSLDTCAEVAAALGDYWSRLGRDLRSRAHTDTGTTPLEGRPN
jgi:hypothetical protein